MKNLMTELKALQKKAQLYDKMSEIDWAELSNKAADVIDTMTAFQDVAEWLIDPEAIREPHHPDDSDDSNDDSESSDYWDGPVENRHRQKFVDRFHSIVEYVNEIGETVSWKDVKDHFGMGYDGTSQNMLEELRHGKQIKVDKKGRKCYLTPRGVEVTLSDEDSNSSFSLSPDQDSVVEFPYFDSISDNCNKIMPQIIESISDGWEFKISYGWMVGIHNDTQWNEFVNEIIMHSITLKEWLEDTTSKRFKVIGNEIVFR